MGCIQVVATLSSDLIQAAGSFVLSNPKLDGITDIQTVSLDGVGLGGVDTMTIDGAEYITIDAISTIDGVDTLMADLMDLGLIAASQFGRVVSGLLPTDGIADLLGIGSLQSASAGLAQANIGSVTSQSDAALRADVSRDTFNVDGEGVTVGVLSDSFNTSPFFAITAEDDVASGDLPDDVLVLEDFDSGGTIDEGRAMLQLIHDIAPGADLQFATAFTGQAGFANNILALAAAGSDVIVDDIIYFAEPAFADGIIAQAAAQVVEDGVPYFSSAGNNANAGYESAFVDSGVAGFFGSLGVAPVGTTHDWDPGEGVDPVLDFVLDSGTTRFILQWDDPYASTGFASPGASTDLDIFLTLPGTDPSPAATFFGANTVNIGGDPVEVFSITNNGGPVELGLSIELFSGPAPENMRIIAFDPNDFVDAEYDFFAPTVYGHAAAKGALGVGAADWDETPEFGVNPPLLESFSSNGPVEILFDTDGNRLATPEIRDAVDFVASQGDNNTFFINDSPDDDDLFPNFFGTSASAPNAAAVAALLLQMDPTLTPAEIEALLEESAIDMDDPYTEGFDFGEDDGTGAGLIQADVALQNLFDSAVEVVRVNDWYNAERDSGGFNATFKLTLEDYMIDGGFVEKLELDVDHRDVEAGEASFSTGWFTGFKGPIAFNTGEGLFTNADAGSQPTLEAGDMITFSVQVQGAGFDFEDFDFQFTDVDPVPAVPSEAEPLDVVAEVPGANFWGAGAVQDVKVVNNGSEAIDTWAALLTLDEGEGDLITDIRSWRADVFESDDGDSFLFVAEDYNAMIEAGEMESFGFRASFDGRLDALPWDADDFQIVSVEDVTGFTFDMS